MKEESIQIGDYVITKEEKNTQIEISCVNAPGDFALIEEEDLEKFLIALCSFHHEHRLRED
jgi:hypothetical protein